MFIASIKEIKLGPLLKNNRPIFNFKGYYGKVVQLKEDNIIFIASSKLGSSLFQFSNNNKLESTLQMPLLKQFLFQTKNF